MAIRLEGKREIGRRKSRASHSPIPLAHGVATLSASAGHAELRRDYERLIKAARRYHRALRTADTLYSDPATVDVALHELTSAALALGPPDTANTP